MALKNVKVKDALTKDFLKFTSKDSFSHIITVMSDQNQLYAIRKVKDKIHLIDLSRNTGEKTTLNDLLVNVPILAPSNKVEKAIKLMNSNKLTMLPVVSNKRLIGVVTAQKIENLKQIKKIMKRK